MPTFYDSIPVDLGEWALSQPLFFTASAPLHNPNSHVNISPKGLPSSTLTIISPNQVAYLDATGSGCETISHIYENGRVTLMFCSFGKAPRICRFFCRGRVVEWDSVEFGGWVERMGKGGKVCGVRAVVVLDVWKVQTSCGWGVPQFSDDKFEASEAALIDRPTLNNYAAKTEAKGKMREYQMSNNQKSLDGLPGLKTARRDCGEWLWLTDLSALMRRIGAQMTVMILGIMLGMMLMGVLSPYIPRWADLKAATPFSI